MNNYYLSTAETWPERASLCHSLDQPDSMSLLHAISMTHMLIEMDPFNTVSKCLFQDQSIHLAGLPQWTKCFASWGLKNLRLSHSLYPSQYFPKKLPTRQRQGQHSEPQKTLSQIRDHTHSQNPIPLGWKPSVPPEAIQAIRNPAPNLGGDSLLKHRALQPEDQRGNRNKGRNTHLNINKPRTYTHSKARCPNSSVRTQSSTAREPCHHQNPAMPLNKPWIFQHSRSTWKQP